MLEKIIIIKNGERSQIDLIDEFQINGKDYALMTLNEIDQNGLIKILASEVSGNSLIKIENEDDWTVVKNVMRSIISASGGDFVYTSTVSGKEFQVADEYARVIAVQDSAKEALIKDYQVNKPQVGGVVENAPVVNEVGVESQAQDIYPTESVVAPIGSEVIPGIAETPVVPQNDVAPVDQAPVETPIQEPVLTENVAQGAIPTPTDIPVEQDDDDDMIESAPVESPLVEETQAQEVMPTQDFQAGSSADAAMEQLINEIIDAVDRYLLNKNVTDNYLRNKLNQMQDDLNVINDKINQTQV